MFKLRERTAESDVSRKVVPDKRSLNRERPLTKALNPFTAAHVKFTARKMHERTCKQCIFRSYNTSIFNAICFNENLFTSRCEKENNMAEWFQI